MGKIALMTLPLRLLCLLACLSYCILSNGQHSAQGWSGRLVTQDGKSVAGASVLLTKAAGVAVLAFAISTSNGNFDLEAEGIADSLLILRVEHLQYEPLSLIIRSADMTSGLRMGDVLLTPRSQTMKEINIRLPPSPYKIHNDTTEFRAAAYRSVETRKVEDLLKNIRGFQLADDGRIFFQGREIERLLLDGEDLTANNYKLLSKNLNATLVDKVQVIDNYASDRLIRSVDQSGKIAVNLTIDSLYHNRLSGSTHAATAVQRHLLDLSMIYPGRKIKWVTFNNYNQVGMQTGAQLNDDRLGEPSNGEIKRRRLLNAVFEPMQISTPPLDVRYAHENEDVSGVQVLSVRGGKGLSGRLLTGLGRSRIRRSSELESRINAVGGGDWMLQQQNHFSLGTKEMLVSLDLSHDDGGKATGGFSMNLTRTIRRQSYEDQISGDLSDSLTQDSRQDRETLTSRGRETWQIRSGALIRLTYGLDLDQVRQDQHLFTGRFTVIGSPVNVPESFHQDLVVRSLAGQATLSLHDKSARARWTGGLRISVDREQQLLSNSGMPSFLSAADRSANRLQSIHSHSMVMNGAWQSVSGRRIRWFLNGEAGIAPFEVRDSAHRILPDPLVYRFSAGMDHRFSMLSALRFSAFRKRWSPANEWFHAGPVLQADGLVSFAASVLMPETVSGLNMSVSRVDLSKSFTGLLHLSWNVTNGAYRQTPIRNPAYTLNTYMPFDGQRSLSVAGSLSRHFPALRCKFTTDLSLLRNEGDARLDDIPIRNGFGVFSIRQRLITAFAFPLNVECSFSIDRYFNRVASPAAGMSHAVQWQHAGYVRLNGRFGERGFGSMIYAHRAFIASGPLRTFDLYARWKATRSLFMSITGHNLTNARTIDRRMVSLNATTDQRTSLVGRYILFGIEWSF